MISEFGKYQGYTEAIYDGSQRTSEYLTLSDSTRLTFGLIIPTKKGIPANKPLPTLYKYSPYRRAWIVFNQNGKLLVDDFDQGWVKSAYLNVRHWLRR